jgi:ribonuclease-3
MNHSNDFIPYILNDKNIYITNDFIIGLLAKYNITSLEYSPKNTAIFQRAMTHSSYIMRDFEKDKLLRSLKDRHFDKLEKISVSSNNLVIPLQTESYERLEYLGDSVIHLIMAEYLYLRYNDKDEGFLTKLRTKIENGTTLAFLAKELGLHKYVLIAGNIEQMGGRETNAHIFEDTFEAFLGALYLDSNYNLPLCKKFVINIIEKHIDMAALIYKETNHKDILLQYYHKMHWPDPEYKLKEITEIGMKKYFHMYVVYNNGQIQIAGHGKGTNKKKAEQIAAYNALLKFGVLNEVESDEEFAYE